MYLHFQMQSSVTDRKFRTGNKVMLVYAKVVLHMNNDVLTYSQREV